RRVSGIYAKRDLEKWFNLRSMRTSLAHVTVNESIAGRYYQKEAIRKTCEALDEKNRRKALLVMATGSGKTRTVIALCDVLLQHGWVKNILFLAQVGHAQVGQKVDKAALGLRNQRCTVGQKQDILHPAMAQKHIAQGDNGARFAAAGGHHQQRLAAVFRVESLAGFADGFLLVIAPGDIIIDIHMGKACAHGSQVEPFFQIALGVDGRHPALGVLPVDDAGFKAIGQKHHRPASVLFFQQIGIQLGLLAACGHILAGAFGLDHGQRTVGVIIQHIIGKAFAGRSGHAVQLHLVAPVPAFHPARINQHHVDVCFAGLIFGHLQRLGRIGGQLLLAPYSQFGLEGFVFPE
ncbi:MAG: DEAD/DEAH box helicase family protein, partial [Clostridia bacterium]|nr:DEAD/DEAH box helicase family protein [Clostridia bacterium]